MTFYHHQESGQGLIEVLVVFLIVTICVVGLTQYQSSLTTQDNAAKLRGEATTLAVKQIETLRDFATISGYNLITSGSQNTTLSGTPYAITWTVTESTDKYPYKTVKVTVTYNDKKAVQQSVSMVTNIVGSDPLASASVMSGLGGAGF